MKTQFYVDSSQFSNRQAVFYVNPDDNTQVSFAGFSDGNPAYATTTVPPNSLYNLNVAATIGSGSSEEQPLPFNPHMKPKKGGKQSVSHDFVGSGLSTGNYNMVHQPWPTNWNVYIVQNLQLDPNALYFNEAGTEALSDYDAYFPVSNFNTSGTLTQMADHATWALQPNLNYYFQVNRIR